MKKLFGVLIIVLLFSISCSYQNKSNLENNNKIVTNENSISQGKQSDILSTSNEQNQKNKNSDISTLSKTNNTKIKKETIYSIFEVMKKYEHSLPDAINRNDFSMVKDTLIVDSNLYKAQKKLVEDLNKKSVNEYLEEFVIKKVVGTDKQGEYKVYTSEKIAIQYPGKDYVTKDFNWIYIVVCDDKKCGINDIISWNIKDDANNKEAELINKSLVGNWESKSPELSGSYAETACNFEIKDDGIIDGDIHSVRIVNNNLSRTADSRISGKMENGKAECLYESWEKEGTLTLYGITDEVIIGNTKTTKTPEVATNWGILEDTLIFFKK